MLDRLIKRNRKVLTWSVLSDRIVQPVPLILWVEPGIFSYRMIFSPIRLSNPLQSEPNVPLILQSYLTRFHQPVEINQKSLERNCRISLNWRIVWINNCLFQNSDQTSGDLLTNCTGSAQCFSRVVHGNHELKCWNNLLQRLLKVFES